jgi:hypothetical protein
MSDESDVQSAGEIRKGSSKSQESPTIIRNVDNFPAALHRFIPLAEQFDASRGLIRQNILATATGND